MKTTFPRSLDLQTHSPAETFSESLSARVLIWLAWVTQRINLAASNSPIAPCSRLTALRSSGFEIRPPKVREHIAMRSTSTTFVLQPNIVSLQHANSGEEVPIPEGREPLLKIEASIAYIGTTTLPLASETSCHEFNGLFICAPTSISRFRLQKTRASMASLFLSFYHSCRGELVVIC